MTTLSLTLPISCQICLGKVKDPVICPNNHAFCTLCLDVWLQANSCCPTCRVGITKEKPYRKVIGSTENNEILSLQTRMQLRKTRLELLEREYETDIQNLNRQLQFMTQENEKLKQKLKSKETTGTAETPAVRPALLSGDVEAFSSLTEKLQEISTTYDDVRRDMVNLQQERDKLQRENDELKNEVAKLREDSLFTKSPKRYEKFTITGLKAKVEKYEKENQQLKKALENSDKYLEKLQLELRTLKTESGKSFAETETAMINSQGSKETDEGSAEVDNEESVPNTMAVRQLRSNDEFESTISTAPLNRQNSSEIESSSTTTAPTSVQTPSHETEQCRTPLDDAPSTSAETNDKCSRDLFPAIKKLLALKKIHEERHSSSSPSPQNVGHVAPPPVLDLPWSSCVPYVNFDSSNVPSEETTVTTSTSAVLQESSETFSYSFPENNQCSETTSNNVILTAAGPWAVPARNSSGAEDTNFANSGTTPKRNTCVEPFVLNKKIKVEKD